MVSSSALIRVENMKWNAVTQRAPSTISPLYRTRQTPSTTGRFTFSIKSMTIVARPLPLQNKRGVARKKKRRGPNKGCGSKNIGRGFIYPRVNKWRWALASSSSSLSLLLTLIVVSVLCLELEETRIRRGGI